jgi:TRAP-type mannitol/chloroaromatic compound transport system permease small subunit
MILDKRHFLHGINIVNEKVGQGVRFLLIPLLIVTLAEVILRYAFNAPTIWAWDLNLQIFGAVILLGGAYTLLHDKHTRVDLILIYLPRRCKSVLESIAMLLVMFVALILTWQGGIEGWESVVTQEKLNTTWAPPIYHIKMLLPISGVLLFFQAIAKFIHALVGGPRGDE